MALSLSKANAIPRNERSADQVRECRFPPLSKNEMLKISVLLGLVVAMTMVGLFTFIFLTAREENLFESNYNLITKQALQVVDNSLERAGSGANTLASLYRNAFPDVSQWPNVSLPYFSEIATQNAYTAGYRTSFMAPLVLPYQAAGWESFAYDRIRASTLYPQDTGLHSFGRGIYAVDPSLGTSDNRYHDSSGNTTWGSPKKALFPVLDAQNPADPADANRVLLNLHSLSDQGRSLDDIIDCALARAHSGDNASNIRSIPCARLTNAVDFSSTDQQSQGATDAYFNLYSPIFPPNNSTVLVGVIVAVHSWSRVLRNAVSSDIEELVAVIRMDDLSYTYVFVNGVPRFLGEGDLHERDYDSHAKTRIALDGTELTFESASFSVTFYPTSAFVNSFRTLLPLYESLASVGIMLFTASIFGVFLFFLRRETTKKDFEIDEKRLFVRFISHEVRSPLNSIAMGLQLFAVEFRTLAKQFKATPKENKSRDQSIVENNLDQWNSMLQDMQESNKSATLVLDDLLFYDSIHTQTMQIKHEPIPLWNFLRRELMPFRRRAQQSGVHLSFDLELWRSMVTAEKRRSLERLVLMADAGRISQVVRVLIKNALKYSPGDTPVTVTVNWDDSAAHARSVRRSGLAKWLSHSAASYESAFFRSRSSDSDCIESGTVTICVKDSGNGFTAEQIQRIAEEGVRFKLEQLNVGESIALDQELAAAIVHSHNGTMRVESEGLGKGSSFIVRLPVHSMDSVCVDDLVPETPSDKSVWAAGLRSSAVWGARRRSVTRASMFSVSLAASMFASTRMSASPFSVEAAKAADSAAKSNASMSNADFGAGVAGAAAGTSRKQNLTAELVGASNQKAEEAANASSPPASSLVPHVVPDRATSAASAASTTLVGEEEAPASREGGGALAALRRDKMSERNLTMPTEGKKVLVVDDVAINRKMLIRLLTKLGFVCEEAKNGQEAVDLFSALPVSERFDMISMDFEMPVMNGPTATKILLERDCDSLIVGVTGNVLPVDLKFFLDHGADAVLPKPLIVEDILRVWNQQEEYLQRRAQRKAEETADETADANASAQASRTTAGRSTLRFSSRTLRWSRARVGVSPDMMERGEGGEAAGAPEREGEGASARAARSSVRFQRCSSTASVSPPPAGPAGAAQTRPHSRSGVCGIPAVAAHAGNREGEDSNRVTETSRHALLSAEKASRSGTDRGY